MLLPAAFVWYVASAELVIAKADIATGVSVMGLKLGIVGGAGHEGGTAFAIGGGGGIEPRVAPRFAGTEAACFVTA